jgi:hypothetical protein
VIPVTDNQDFSCSLKQKQPIGGLLMQAGILAESIEMNTA